MKTSIVQARPEHVEDFEALLRKPELQGLLTRDATNILRKEFRESFYVWTGLIEDRVAAIWGVRCRNAFSTEGYVWLIATKVADEHPLVFLRHSHEALRTLDGYRRLFGYVLNSFESSKAWLRFMGFTIGEPRDIDGQVVCEFWLER